MHASLSRATQVDNHTTPAKRLRPSITRVYSPSDTNTPSLSVVRPFDWDAARGLKPPPYMSTATPNSVHKRRLRHTLGGAIPSTPNRSSLGGPPINAQRRPLMLRKIGLWERISTLPERWLFKLEMLHHELPLPSPQTMGTSVGVLFHLLSAFVRWNEIKHMRDEDYGWEDMKGETDAALAAIFADEDVDGDESSGWVRWTTVLSLALMILSVVNALFLFTRTKTYDFQLRDGETPLMSTPNASYVESPVERHLQRSTPPIDPTIWTYIASGAKIIWRWTKHAWRFLRKTPHDQSFAEAVAAGSPRIQQLELWDPQPSELAAFSTYSPLHALLWPLLTPSNWISVSAVMIVLWFQTSQLIKAYTVNIKDRHILHAEVMFEYDNRFVYPRMNPIKKDACVMTHQAEMIEPSEWRTTAQQATSQTQTQTQTQTQEQTPQSVVKSERVHRYDFALPNTPQRAPEPITPIAAQKMVNGNGATPASVTRSVRNTRSRLSRVD